jgi:tetratricopeptide (TPR) repeat protein
MTKSLSDSQVLRYLEHARGYLLLDMPQAALRELNEISESKLSRTDFFILKAEAYRSMQDYEESRQNYLMALDYSPERQEIFLGLAWCEKRLGWLSLSIRRMLDAHRLEPQEPLVMYNLSCYYALDGQSENAIIWLRKALEEDCVLINLIANESDFDQIRDDLDFQQLVEHFLKEASQTKKD